MNLTWEDAILKAKRELGHEVYGYIEDYDKVVERAKIISRRDYHAYLESEEWKERAAKVMARENYKCNECGKQANNVHHLTYKNKGTEWELNDCIAVCKPGHTKTHREMMR